MWIGKNKAQGLLEYILIVSLLVIIAILVLSGLGISVKDVFASIFGPQEEVYLFDNFKDLANWKAIYGANKWTVSDGWLEVTNPGEQRLMNTGELPSDYTINFDQIQLLKGNGYGLMFRLSPSGNNYSGYSFQVDPGYGNKFIFRRYDQNGVELSKPLAVGTPPASFDWNAPHKVSVSVVGNTFKAYIDNALVLSATDSNYGSGAAGVRVWDSTLAKFNGFSVTPPTK